MCGITGYLNLDGGVDLLTLYKMNDVIRHRGPDDEGYALIGTEKTQFCGGSDTMDELKLPLLNQFNGSEFFLGLGHRRLSILDLSVAGHQPMSFPQRDIILTYNGEIYNYLELKTELEEKGYHFQTTSDTEVLLYAYCAWGEDCLSHLNGMWGFALWDGQKNKLFCARDRLGAKPFHYYWKEHKFLFGSELKQLCQDNNIQRRFDHSYLAANLLYRISDYNDQTLIKDMKVLRAGHKLVVQLNSDRTKIDSVTISPYWTLRVEYDEIPSEQEWCDNVSTEFSRSCSWRMRSDAPLSALLSGGLDSSCMVTEMCSQLSDPTQLQTFTTSYPGDASCDEWYYANLVNQACGCKGNQIIPKPSEIEKQFENIIWHIEGTGGLALLGVKILLDEIHRRGFKVVLNGQCGDELMLGYERYYSFYFSKLLRSRQVGKFLSEIRLAALHSRFNMKMLLLQWIYFNNAVVRNNRQLLRVTPFINADLLAHRNKDELARLLYPKSLEELQYNELTATQLTHIVRFDDRLYMSSSLESRIPFMDYKLVELGCRIPPDFKIKQGYTKYIMRKIFDHKMPKEVTWRTNKMGFGAPVNQWAQEFSKDYLLEQIKSAKTAPYFKTKRLENMVLKSQQNPSIFEFLAMELFARQFHVNE